MTHLTLCGMYAGETLCGAAKTADNQYLHAMWAPIDKLKANEIPNYGPLCTACLKMWEEAGE